MRERKGRLPAPIATPLPMPGMRIKLSEETREWHDQYVTRGDYANVVRLANQKAKALGEPQDVNRWAVTDAIKNGEGRPVIVQALNAYYSVKARLQSEAAVS